MMEYLQRPQCEGHEGDNEPPNHGLFFSSSTFVLIKGSTKEKAVLKRVHAELNRYRC